jgi:hypothetical protein
MGAKAHRIGSDGMLGFIRFDKLRGTLELTNFNAKLPRKALLLGASSKQNQDSMAGTHGEGFKVASLVMVRNGYQVRYESVSIIGNSNSVPETETKISRIVA